MTNKWSSESNPAAPLLSASSYLLRKVAFSQVRFIVLLGLMAILLPAGLLEAQTQTQGAPIPFGPIPISQTVGPQQFTVTANGTVSVNSNQGEYFATVNTRVDLSGLQQVLPAIARQQGSHRDDCGQDLDLHTTQLTPSINDQASLSAAGHFGLWHCDLAPAKRIP